MRATSASRLFAKDIPEKVIQGRTGHHSLAGLRAYESTTEDQEHMAAKLLSSITEGVKSERKKLILKMRKMRWIKLHQQYFLGNCKTVFSIFIANDETVLPFVDVGIYSSGVDLI